MYREQYWVSLSSQLWATSSLKRLKIRLWKCIQHIKDPVHPNQNECLGSHCLLMYSWMKSTCNDGTSPLLVYVDSHKQTGMCSTVKSLDLTLSQVNSHFNLIPLVLAGLSSVWEIMQMYAIRAIHWMRYNAWGQSFWEIGYLEPLPPHCSGEEPKRLISWHHPATTVMLNPFKLLFFVRTSGSKESLSQVDLPSENSYEGKD